MGDGSGGGGKDNLGFPMELSKKEVAAKLARREKLAIYDNGVYVLMVTGNGDSYLLLPQDARRLGMGLLEAANNCERGPEA